VSEGAGEQKKGSNGKLSGVFQRKSKRRERRQTPRSYEKKTFDEAF